MIAGFMATLGTIFLGQITGQLVDRFNYASFDCAARILATSPDTKAAWAILQPHQRDSYMSFLCKNPSKFIVVELCSDIRIDTIVLANMEHFSSTFEKFRVFGGKKFSGAVPPVYNGDGEGEWIELGTFSGKNTRDEQDFPLPSQDKGFIRFLKIEFLTNYGKEYFCPVSFIKVFGKTMMEDYVDNQAMALINQQQKSETFRSKFELVPFTGKWGKEECRATEENIYKAMDERLKRLEKRILRDEEVTLEGAENDRKNIDLLEERIQKLKQIIIALLIITILNLAYSLFFLRPRTGISNGHNNYAGRNFTSTPGPILFDDSFHTGNHSSSSQTAMSSPRSSKLR